MNKKKNKQKYTSLVGVKWTQESLEKCLMDMFIRYNNELVRNKEMSISERIKKLVLINSRFLSIYYPVKHYGVTVKK